jgi:hypothetical protein
MSPVSIQQPAQQTIHLDAKVGEWYGIRAGCRPDDDVEAAVRGEDVLADDLSQSAFQSVAIDRRLSMSWHDEANPRKAERGSARPD